MRFFVFTILALWLSSLAATAQEARWPDKTKYRSARVHGHKMFYREAGDPEKPTLVLLHGYPSSSHSYRELLPLLSGYYHVIAPDNLGSGYSDKPSSEGLTYTFDLLAAQVTGLLEELGVDSYSLYIQDFGAPVGFRMMMENPEHIEALITQNANAYLEGLTPKRQLFFREAQTDRSPENLAKLYSFTGPDAVRHKQYLRDVKGREEIMSPDAWTHDIHFLSTEEERNIQVQLFQDYKSNLDAYPEWQAFLRKHQFPTLVVWGKNDPAFIEAGARAYLKDLPNAELNLLEAGHFAAEEQPVEVAKAIVRFLEGLRQEP